MKKFYKIIAVLTITCTLGFCACGANKPNNEVQNVEVKKTTETESKELKEIPHDEISNYVESVDSQAVLDYVSDDKENVGIYMVFHVNNKTEDEVVCDLSGTISLYTETDELIATEGVSICTLAPGETGLAAAYFELTKDELNTNPKAVLNADSANCYNVDNLSGFAQSDLEISDFSTESDGTMNTSIQFTIANSSNKSVKNCDVMVLCKKDGKCVGFANSGAIVALNPGNNPVNVDGSHFIPSDCDDYEIFIDYISWDN